MRVVVSGGGTGGHVYPALAIIRAVKELSPEARFLYLGTARGLEARLVPHEGLDFVAIPGQGLIRKGAAGALRAVFSAVSGTAAALRAIRRFAPDVVVGTGGYVSGPVALAARLARVPLLLHEQNVTPGFTNRVAARWARAVAVPHEAARSRFRKATRTVVTGNPVRRSVTETTSEEGLRLLGLPETSLVVYIVGGSLGARAINEAAAGAIPGWLEDPATRVILVTGRRYYDEMTSSLGGRHPADRVRLLAYLDRPDAALAAASVVVTRGGAMSLAEIAAAGVPSVIIPSPNVAHDEQESNGLVFERAGAARLLRERDLSPESLGEAVRAILHDPELRARMRDAARSLARPEAARDLARLVTEVAGDPRGRPPAARSSRGGPHPVP